MPDYDPTSLANNIDEIKANIKELEAGAEREYATLREYRQQLLDPKPGGFSPDVLERGVEGCKKNIAVIEAAIEVERVRIKDQRMKIEQLVHCKHVREIADKGVHVEVVRDGDNN